MKIGVIGATGKAGILVVNEALQRNHQVVAIVRNASKLQEKNVVVIEKDIIDLEAADIQGLDVLVNAFGAPFGQEHLFVVAMERLIEILKQSPSTRLIVIGGAGSLYTDESLTTRLIDLMEVMEDIPEEVKPTGRNAAKSFELLQASSEIQWTYISPPPFFDAEGPRTRSYQKGKDILIKNSKGNSYVSYSDFVIALLDEIEQPQHTNARFTVVSEET
ncbi:NAD(P)-dependent oxidoreductase [Paenibacillus sp. FSL R10-2782]|uniref:NAD(P)-dependent oxidoreductase n=1 Tax=Paenibacillus sp. FSL R10-2782 TaxID=2954661 RepID=UPI003159643F